MESARYLIADIQNTTVVYKMTSFYGKNGVYFGFEGKDDTVFYNGKPGQTPAWSSASAILLIP